MLHRHAGLEAPMDQRPPGFDLSTYLRERCLESNHVAVLGMSKTIRKRKQKNRSGVMCYVDKDNSRRSSVLGSSPHTAKPSRNQSHLSELVEVSALGPDGKRATPPLSHPPASVRAIKSTLLALWTKPHG